MPSFFLHFEGKLGLVVLSGTRNKEVQYLTNEQNYNLNYITTQFFGWITSINCLLSLKFKLAALKGSQWIEHSWLLSRPAIHKYLNMLKVTEIC